MIHNIADLIDNAAANGAVALKMRAHEAEIAAAQERARLAAKYVEEWQPVLDALRAVLPWWTHEYLAPGRDRHEGYRHDNRCVYPAYLDLPGCGRIYLWSCKRSGEWGYGMAAATYTLRHDDYGDGGWYVVCIEDEVSPFSLADDFSMDSLQIAIHEAHERGATKEKLSQEAEERNRQAREAPPTAEDVGEVAPTDYLRWAKASVDHERYDQAVAFALIALVEEVRGLVSRPF